MERDCVLSVPLSALSSWTNTNSVTAPLQRSILINSYAFHAHPGPPNLFNSLSHELSLRILTKSSDTMSANVLIQQPDQPELIGMQVTASFRRAARFLAEQDEVYSDFDNDRWVMVFLETDSSSESLQKKNIQFKLAKDAFLSQPHRTIEILEEFASCLATDDLVANFLLQLHNQGPNTVKCWLEIQSLFNSYFETSEDNSPASEDDSINVDDNNLSAQIQEFGDLAQIVRGCKIDGGGGEKASRQVQDFIDKTQEMHQKRLKSRKWFNFAMSKVVTC